MDSLQADIGAYDAWLRTQCKVDEKALRLKRKRMTESSFAFLRATYFRWAKTIEGVCPELSTTPRIACIGDIHVENFGTWRDAEARLVWGVNDFDEVAVMPYAFDLVRLAVSALLSPGMRASVSDVAGRLLQSYKEGLMQPRVSLLDEAAGWLRAFASPTQESNEKFWRDVDKCKDTDPPFTVQRALLSSLPTDSAKVRFASRITGGGSLGRPRFLAVATWNGGRVVREAKAYVPSAWTWAHRKRLGTPWYFDLAKGAYRSPDPFLHGVTGFTIRRVAPDSRKIELGDVGHALSLPLLGAMAADLAAIHASDPRFSRVLEDLAKRQSAWLEHAAAAALSQVKRDFETYIKG